MSATTTGPAPKSNAKAALTIPIRASRKSTIIITQHAVP